MALYTVQANDNLGLIATKFGVTMDAIWLDPQNAQLRTARHDDRGKLQIGDILFIPVDNLKTDGHLPGGGDANVVVRRSRVDYVVMSYTNAFGAFDPFNWDPLKGWVANRERS